MDFIERFRAALKIQTWWPAGASAGDAEAEASLLRFQEFLAESYPNFHRAAQRQVINPYSVLYRWPGTDNAETAKANAVLIVAHYDVVPVETEKWSVDPFGAEMKDGFIYGRGSLDMKAMLISFMEAAEKLCNTGFKPKCDIWFAFGGDEERFGALGALEAVKWFTGQGQRFAWILDEGTPIVEDQIKNVSSPLAFVSIEEKGMLNLELSVTQEPGHASMPPKTQATAVLARALCRIAKRPFPFILCSTVESFFRQLAPLVPGFRGFAMRFARRLGPLFFKAAASSPATAAILRTTAAMTQLEGSLADNVLPSEVRAVINLRLLQPWTVESAMAFIKKAVKDERVRIRVRGANTNPVTANRDYESVGWLKIRAALAETWPGVPMLPFIMVAATDSRHFKELAADIFRFNPYKLSTKEMGGVHGHDERISLENLNQGLKFYTKLLETL